MANFLETEKYFVRCDMIPYYYSRWKKLLQIALLHCAFLKGDKDLNSYNILVFCFHSSKAFYSIQNISQNILQ